MTEPKEKPVVRLKRSGRQLGKAEMEEDIGIDATPEEAARAVLTPVRIEFGENARYGQLRPIVVLLPEPHSNRLTRRAKTEGRRDTVPPGRRTARQTRRIFESSVRRNLEGLPASPF